MNTEKTISMKLTSKDWSVLAKLMKSLPANQTQVMRMALHAFARERKIAA